MLNDQRRGERALPADITATDLALARDLPGRSTFILVTLHLSYVPTLIHALRPGRPRADFESVAVVLMVASRTAQSRFGFDSESFRLVEPFLAFDIPLIVNAGRG